MTASVVDTIVAASCTCGYVATAASRAGASCGMAEHVAHGLAACLQPDYVPRPPCDVAGVYLGEPGVPFRQWAALPREPMERAQ